MPALLTTTSNCPKTAAIGHDHGADCVAARLDRAIRSQYPQCGQSVRRNRQRAPDVVRGRVPRLEDHISTALKVSPEEGVVFPVKSFYLLKSADARNLLRKNTM